jgi:hypothetical protein
MKKSSTHPNIQVHVVRFIEIWRFHGRNRRWARSRSDDAFSQFLAQNSYLVRIKMHHNTCTIHTLTLAFTSGVEKLFSGTALGVGAGDGCLESSKVADLFDSSFVDGSLFTMG